MHPKQDFFISHATSDKSRYIYPLAKALKQRDVTYWLDDFELSWGDSVAMGINEGLRTCRRIVICLSRAFLDRPWPEAELSAAFAEPQKKKALPLILNSKKRVLRHYPLLAGLSYREYSLGVSQIADDLQTIAGKKSNTADLFQISIESIHTGQLSYMHAKFCASIGWLCNQARITAGLKENLETGGYQSFSIRWVLVDRTVEHVWEALDDTEKEKVWAIVAHADGFTASRSARDSLEKIGVYNGIRFHLYAVPKVVEFRGSGGGFSGRPDVVYYEPERDDNLF